MIKRSLISAMLLLSGLGAAYAVYMEKQGNFHVVTEGQVYRSAQLDEDELVYYIKTYNLRSILNLRGAHHGDSWYQKEAQIAQSYGIRLYNQELSSQRELDNRQLDAILDIVRAAPKPILIHCKGGADRSGLIAAAYRYKIEGVSADEAFKQLSITYGHLAFLWNKTQAMDRSFWRYVGQPAR